MMFFYVFVLPWWYTLCEFTDHISAYAFLFGYVGPLCIPGVLLLAAYGSMCVSVCLFDVTRVRLVSCVAVVLAV